MTEMVQRILPQQMDSIVLILCSVVLFQPNIGELLSTANTEYILPTYIVWHCQHQYCTEWPSFISHFAGPTDILCNIFQLLNIVSTNEDESITHKTSK